MNFATSFSRNLHDYSVGVVLFITAAMMESKLLCTTVPVEGSVRTMSQKPLKSAGTFHDQI